jgi:hypothetical protein
VQLGLQAMCLPLLLPRTVFPPSLRADFLPLVPCSFVGPSSLPLADEAYLTRHEAKEKEERTRYEAVLGAWLADSLRAVCSAAQMTGPLTTWKVVACLMRCSDNSFACRLIA